MDLIDKKIKKLEQITDGVAVYNAISYIAKRINEENREKIMGALMRYGDKGLVEFHRGFAVERVAALMKQGDIQYCDFLCPVSSLGTAARCTGQSGDTSKQLVKRPVMR